MARRTWQQVKALLANEEFINSCASSERDPEEVLDVSSYSRADKCSHPIHLNRINPESGEVAQVVVPCDSNNAHICFECSEFKRKLRSSQILGTLDRPNVDIAMLTLTAPSFGSVHRATWNAKDEYRARHLDDAARYRKRLSVQKSRSASICDCKQHHTSDEAIIGTPLSTYDYAGEVLWSANLPRLMNSTVQALKYRAKLSGIAPENFRLFAVYERQKRGSLHAHFLVVADHSPYAFQRFVESFETAWSSPSARITEQALYGLETGFQRIEEDSKLLHTFPKKKRSLESVLPLHKGEPATRFGKVFDIRVLEADASDAMADEVEDIDVLDDLVEVTDDTDFSAELPQHKSYKKAAGYVAKYLTKNNSAFAPDALKDLSAEQRSHFRRFRKTAVLLYTDKLIFDAILRSKQQEIDLLLDNAPLDEAGEPDPQTLLLVERMESARRAFASAGVTRTVIGDRLTQKLIIHTLTVPVVMDLVKQYASAFSPLGLAHASLLNLPARYLKMKLNRVANNAGYTGTLVSTHNWIHTLKDLKESRKAWYFMMNPEAEMIDYIWEMATQHEWTFDAAKFREENESYVPARLLNGMNSSDWLLYMNSEEAVTYADEAAHE